MGVALKERHFGGTKFLHVPSLPAAIGMPSEDNPSRPASRVPSNLARLLKTPEIRQVTGSVTPRAPSGLPATPRPQGASVMTNRTRKKRQDEESLRTKIFWEKYSKEVLGEILKDTEEEKPQSHLIYSGNCGPKLQFHRSDSSESLVTNLSLLSTSSLGNTRAKESKRRKKKKENPQVIKTDWVRLAKERRGALDRLIAKDAANFEGLAQVSGANIIIQRAQVSELMSEEEKALLHNCGFRYGISGKIKSGSTANIMSVVSKSEQAKLEKHRPRSKRLKGSSETPSVMSSRAPSPKVIGKEVRAQKRSESSIAVFNDLQPMSQHRSSVQKGLKPDYHRNLATPVSSIHGLRDFQESNILTQQVKRRITRTLTNLEDMTGFGDPTDAQTVMSDEQSFTRADYALIPRYPQHVRIAPQLCKVIVQDIRKRMGCPGYHELRTADIERLNISLPELGRTARNLMIFNWLSSLDEDYDDSRVPGIYDIEGQPPHDRYPVIYDEIIGTEVSSEAADTDYETETNGVSSVVATLT